MDRILVAGEFGGYPLGTDDAAGCSRHQVQECQPRAASRCHQFPACAYKAFPARVDADGRTVGRSCQKRRYSRALPAARSFPEWGSVSRAGSSGGCRSNIQMKMLISRLVRSVPATRESRAIRRTSTGTARHRLRTMAAPVVECVPALRVKMRPYPATAEIAGSRGATSMRSNSGRWSLLTAAGSMPC